MTTTIDGMEARVAAIKWPTQVEGGTYIGTMDGSYMWSNTGRHEPIKEKIIEEEERKMRIGLQNDTMRVSVLT